jgi:serine/threonine-protein kinase
MSPEQARGLKTLDHRADLYSLGMVAYWMLTGQTAFEGEAFGDLILAICTKPLPSLQEVAPWLPPELDDWFKNACALEPDDRYQSAEEMTEALLAASGVNEGVLHSAGVMTTRFDERARFAMASSPDVASSLRISAATDSAADTMLAATATGSHPSPPRQGLANRTVRILAGAGVALLVLGAGAVLFSGGDSGEVPGASAPESPLVAEEAPTVSSAVAAVAAAAEAADEPTEPTVTPQEAAPEPSASAAPAPKVAASSAPTKAPQPKPQMAAAAAPAQVSPHQPRPPKPKPKPKPAGGDIDIGF